MSNEHRPPTGLSLPEVKQTIAELRDLRDDMALRRVWTSVAFPEVDGLAKSAAQSWERRRSPHRRMAWFVGGAMTAAAAAFAATLWIDLPTAKAPVPLRASVAPVSAGAVAERESQAKAALGTPVRRGGPAVHADKRALPVSLPGGATATLTPGTTVKVDDEDRLVLVEGGSRFDVPLQTQTLVVQVGAYRVVVAGTRFRVDLAANQSVNVAVESGTAEIFGDDAEEVPLAHLAPGSRWSSTGETVASKDVKDTVVKDDDGAGGGLRAVFSGARRRHRNVARQTVAAVDKETPDERPTAEGVAAENAAYERGKNQRDVQHRPDVALKTWRSYRQDHPNGILRAEVDLSIFETLVRTHDAAGAVNEGQAFLNRYPESERRSEVARLLGDLQRVRGEHKRALEAYDISLAAHPRGEMEDHVSFQRAVCLFQMNGEGVAVQKYLDSHPAGRFRKAATSLLAAGGSRAP